MQNISCLQRRVALWENGELSDLLKEGTLIQRSVKSGSNTDVKRAAHKFSSLMMQGKVRAALRSLSDNSESGPLKLEDVLEGSEKHPPALPPPPPKRAISTLLCSTVSQLKQSEELPSKLMAQQDPLGLTLSVGGTYVQHLVTSLITCAQLLQHLLEESAQPVTGKLVQPKIGL